MPKTINYQLFYPSSAQEDYEVQFADTIITIDRLLHRALDGKDFALLLAQTEADLRALIATKAGINHTHIMSEVEGLSTTVADIYSQLAALKAQIGSGTGGTGGTGTTPSVITVNFTSVAAEPSQFTASASSTGGAIVATEWSFGDGATGNGTNTTHTYAAPGRYDVTVLARDGTGASKSAAGRHLVPPPFSRRMPAGGGSQDNYPIVASYVAAQYTDPEVGPPKLISPEEITETSFHLSAPLGPFVPTSGKVRLMGDSTAYTDNTQNGATVGVFVKYGNGDYQQLANLPVSQNLNGFIDATFDLPSGFASGDIRIRVSPPHIDNFSFRISSAEILLDYPDEGSSPVPINQTVTFAPRMATRAITGPSYAGFAVGVGESVTPILRNAIQFRARQPYNGLSGKFEIYTLTDSTSVAYLLPTGANITGAFIEGDVSIAASNGASGGGATLNATPSGGAAATHALVQGEHFSLPVTLANHQGAVALTLQTTMPALTATAQNSNQGQEADYKLTVSNLILRIAFTVP